MVERLESGEVDIVIGTHRLLSGDVTFKNLGLLVVDEEQRFGVSHKESIKQFKAEVDVLTLTATPIPRTLEMSLTGIRDLSLLNTPPAARQPILTYVGEYDERAVTESIRRELLREGQVFYVHNRVRDIEQQAARIRELVPEARVAIAHGQMDEGSLEKVVVDFWQGEYDVLVCTTIIESGIDMPTVNTLVVERADLLGLGQLHQLRGRVGRAGQRAYAYLFFPPDRQLSEEAYERLKTIGESTELGSGFHIAMRDLEIRGAGNLLGTGQSGHVAAVGYDLYVQMVNEAVAELNGEPVEVPEEIVLEIPRRPSCRRTTSSARTSASARTAGWPRSRARATWTTSLSSGSTASARCRRRGRAAAGGPSASGVRAHRRHQRDGHQEPCAVRRRAPRADLADRVAAVQADAARTALQGRRVPRGRPRAPGAGEGWRRWRRIWPPRCVSSFRRPKAAAAAGSVPAGRSA